MSESARDRLPAGAGPNAWLAFAGILLFLNGTFAMMWGLAAVLNSKVITVGGSGVTIWDFTTWGWVSLIIGGAMLLTGIGLFTGNTGARMFALLFVSLHALSQFGSISAFPLWSILVISIDIVILYQLLVRWQLKD